MTNPTPAQASVEAPAHYSAEAKAYWRARGERWQKVFATLRDYRMQNMCCEDEPSCGYPLVDLMSNEGQSIATGEEEMVCLADEIIAALSPPPTVGTVHGPDEDGLYYTVNASGMREACDPPPTVGAEDEAVAWVTKWQFKAPDYPVKYPGGGSSITRDATEAAQELANKQRWDRVDWVRQTPLYAHPAPAAVESAQEVKEGWQPWETAPRDDKDVLAKNGDFYQVVFWDTDDNTGWHVSDANLRYPEGAFSHWRRDCLATEKEG